MDKRKQLETTLTAIGFGTLLTGATYGLCTGWRSKTLLDYENCERLNTSMKKGKKNVMEEDVCPICLEDLIKRTICFSCRHVFHKKCISQWKERSKTCPICRSSL